MNKSIHFRSFVFFLLLALSCEKIPLVEASDRTVEDGIVPWGQGSVLEQSGLYSEQRFRHFSVDEETYLGAINAVKKAYQLTDITFIPLHPIAYNIGTYQANANCKGMIYSSVKEIGTYVGPNVSFHTFMTAIHNPRSKIYTERVDKSPYNGTNCRSYYGTVCSGLVSFALDVAYGSYDFVVSDEMEELDYSDIDSFHIGDVFWKSDHVALITDVVRNYDGDVVYLEISEAVQNGCKRYTVSRFSFLNSYFRSFQKAFRYKYLERNTSYTSVPEFVPVFDEEAVPFVYNDDICVDKGDQSCYFVGEDVILNILSAGDTVEIYKDGVFYSKVSLVETEDLQLTDLDYGLYQARLINGDSYSDFTSWIMIDYSIEPSKEEMIIHFSSTNSEPVSISFCNKSGSRKYPFTEILCRRFTEEEVSQGYISVPQDRIKSDRPYL